ncbi:MAG: sulfate ABC transporter ATP-binding protein [Verrucomicrobiae bacterium]|nr:sulfate ABC transporter ATP-binding protein [Verrucomicrobiae bacterium]
MSVEINHISKQFGSNPVLRSISLKIETGELVALLGPSGSGKTTLLRIIAGLEFADEGQISFRDQDVSSQSAYQRKAGFVFQHYALFNHMTVFQNIAFGLKVRKRSERPSRAEIKKRVEALLQRVQLEDYANRYPAQLSGGQCQRVALARALAIEPQVLLLDEPFGALDAKVRKELRRWLRQFHEETHLTTLFVTHDQEEAFEVADRVVILSDGVIQQQGSPDEVIQNPANQFVNEFLDTE